MQHSALPSGTILPLCHHHVGHMHLQDNSLGIGLCYKLPTLSSPHRRLPTSPKVLGSLPLAASAYFVGIPDVLRGNIIIFVYLVV